jgi:tetratricopeptide (TPR) repeat protein
MKVISYFGLIFLLFLTVFFNIGYAQSKRDLNNEGVDLYSQKKYADSEIKFKKGLEKDPKMFEGHFNLGDAYFKQGRYDEAVQAYKNSLQFTNDKSDQAKVFHNIGNALLKSQKYKESVGAYANALKKNPKDDDTKYNLSYALNMMKQNDNKKQNKNDKNDKNKDKNKDQKQNNQNQNNKNDKNKNQQNQPQQPKNQISKEDAQRILDALKNNEADVQKKLRKQKGKPIATDKDW